MANFDAVTTSGAVLGAILVKLRTEKGMKQSDLAAAVGIGASTWSRIEKGESGLSIEQLRVAAKALSVTPGRIFEMLGAAEDEVANHGVRIETANWSSKAALSTVRSGAAGIAAGVALGSVIPIVGTALGAMIGGALAAYLKDDDKKGK